MARFSTKAKTDKNTSGATQYRVSPREGGKYYAVERRSAGSSEWVSEGSTAPTKEAAEQIVLNLTQGKTADGSMNVSEVPVGSGSFVMSPETTQEAIEATGGATPAVEEKKEISVAVNLPAATHENIAKAKPGDKFKRTNGEIVEVKQEDIDYSKAQLAPKETVPESSTSNEEYKAPSENKESDKTTTPNGDGKDVPYASNSEKAAAMGKYLARNIIEAYNNGDFGEKGTTAAKVNMGMYILNEIGTRLANASSVARGGTASLQSDWSKMKAGNEETNKAIRAYEAQYKNAQEELIASMGKDKWDALPSTDKDSKTLELLQRKGIVNPQSVEGLATTKSEATDEAFTQLQEQTKSYILNNKKLVTDTRAAYAARITELQALKRELSKPDWDSYAKAQNAYLGALKGLAQAGATDTESLAQGKTFNDTLGVGASGTGNIGVAKLSANVSNTSAWGSSTSSATGKTNSINKDLVAYAEYPNAQAYADAAKEKGEAVNKELIENIDQMIDWLKQQIAIYDKYL